MKDCLYIQELYCVSPNGARVINGFSLKVSEKENVFIQAPEAWREALLDIVTGLRRPNRGTISVCNELLYDRLEEEIAAFRCVHIGAVLAVNDFLPEVPLIDSLTLSLILSGMREENARDLIKRTTQKAINSDILYTKPRFLFPIHIAAAAVIRAVSTDPEVLVFDDFVSRLDGKDQKRMWEIIRAIRPENCAMVFMSSAAEPQEMAWTQSISL